MMTIRTMLRGNEALQKDASSAIASYAAFRQGNGDGAEDEVAEENARAVDERLVNAWWLALHILYIRLVPRPESKKILKHLPYEVVWNNQDKKIFDVEDDLRLVGTKINILQERIHQDCYRLTRHLPGIRYDDFESEHDPRTSFESLSEPIRSPFIFPHQIFRSILWHHDDHLIFGAKLLTAKGKDIEWMVSWHANLNGLFQRQLWRLQDLRDGGGLGFAVENFLLSFKQLSSTSPSQDSHSALYIATFRVITSDWRDYRHSLGTQKILLDAVASEQGIVHRFDYPTYITDELLVLLGNVFEGQTGPHIENAMQQLSRPDERFVMQEFRTKALRAISRSP
jgi:hypothetical protein